jgi:hypothetical protein
MFYLVVNKQKKSWKLLGDFFFGQLSFIIFKSSLQICDLALEHINVCTFVFVTFVHNFQKFLILLKGVRIMEFNATFNNISAILWWSVLLVEETVVPGENQI